MSEKSPRAKAEVRINVDVNSETIALAVCFARALNEIGVITDLAPFADALEQLGGAERIKDRSGTGMTAPSLPRRVAARLREPAG